MLRSKSMFQIYIQISHYKNTPIQIYWISPPETETPQIKLLIFFSYFCSKHRLWVLVSTHNLGFWAEIRKIIYTPVNPSFCYIKMGFKGGQNLYRHVSVMDRIEMYLFMLILNTFNLDNYLTTPKTTIWLFFISNSNRTTPCHITLRIYYKQG